MKALSFIFIALALLSDGERAVFVSHFIYEAMKKPEIRRDRWVD